MNPLLRSGHVRVLGHFEVQFPDFWVVRISDPLISYPEASF